MTKRTRHGQYKVGTSKLTCTVSNEDKVRVQRYAISHNYEDASAFLRELIHEAVWDEPLLPEDYETLKRMAEQQKEI